MKKNFKFSPEFRQSAVSRVLNGETQVEVAKSLGISPKTLNVWCLKAKEARSEQENKNLDETARLRLELKKAQAEIEFLKKSLEPDSLSRGGQQYFPITPFLNGVAKPTLAIYQSLRAVVSAIFCTICSP